MLKGFCHHLCITVVLNSQKEDNDRWHSVHWTHYRLHAKRVLYQFKPASKTATSSDSKREYVTHRSKKADSILLLLGVNATTASILTSQL